MAKARGDKLHDQPDRMVREQLRHPDNLRDLLSEVVPALAPRFDFAKAREVDRAFRLEDWHGREADLLFLIPLRTGKGTQTVLVLVLVEHQSQTDPLMPLRTLLYAVLYWEREWRAWEALPTPRPEFRLSPVLPVVFHTGPAPWGSNKALAELVEGPQELKALLPAWQPLFWDLAAYSAEELLEKAGWLQALAVVRMERGEAGEFRGTLAAALRKVEGLSARDPVRWHELLHFLLSWALHRRPDEEHGELIEAARASQASARHRKEIQAMSKTIAEALYEQGEARGLAQGIEKGELLALQKILTELLEQRFGPLPRTVARRIKASSDRARLRDCIINLHQWTSLKDLNL